MLSPAARSDIKTQLAAAAHRDRSRTARRLADVYGVSAATIYRVAKLGGASRTRNPERPEYRNWSRALWLIAHDPGLQRPLPLDLALRAGIEAGHLPPEAVAMPVETARRIARDELGLKPRPRRTHRMHADYPMQAVQIDYSTSEYLLADREEGDDWALRLHRRPTTARGYKNRPLAPHRMRVGVYSLWDMCTGYTVARYGVALGENAPDALDFLCWAVGRGKDSRLVIHGVPDDLWTDLGPLARSDLAADLLGRLQIALITGEPYNKSRMGGVERSHGIRWARFERALFVRGEEAIRLSELNARLVEYTVEENASRASRTRVNGRRASRTDAWTALINGRPADNPLRRLPEDPMKTVARQVTRRVDVNGILRWEGVEYEIPDWHDRAVTVRKALDDSDAVIVEDASGERRTAWPYAPRPYGVVPKTAPSPLERLQAEGGRLHIAADLYAPRGEAETGNVTRMQARSAPAAFLENPLAGADAFPDLGDAMRCFVSIYPWPLSAANRDRVIKRIEASGLSRQAVKELAQQLAGLSREQGGG